MGIFARRLEDQLIEIETEGLSPSQIRLLRSMNAMLLHVLTTHNECEFFDGSAEFMRIAASIIKHANFSRQKEGAENIAYADQALEYSMDILQECMTKSKVIQYDN